MRVLVIGGGIVGLNIAMALQARNSDVILLEPRPQIDGASYGNAGHIATEQVAPLASWATIASAPQRWFMRGGALSLPPSAVAAWLPFSLRMMAAASPRRFAAGVTALKGLLAEAMPAWQRRLGGIGAGSLLRSEGHFVVWESEASARKGMAAWSATDTGTARFRPVTDGERAQVSALVRRPIHGAIRFDQTGQITDTQRLLETLKTAFEMRGGAVMRHTAERLIVTAGKAQVGLAGGERLEADVVVVSAGVASRPLLETLGIHVPMIAERGYHIQAAGSRWPDYMPPVVFEDRSIIVTAFESGLRACSFVEFARPDDPADPRKWARLRAHIDDLGLPFEGACAQWMGARPTLPDYLPAIGRLAGSNLYYAFGHQHLGLTLGAVTGDMVTDLVAGGDASAAFDLKRFFR